MKKINTDNIGKQPKRGLTAGKLAYAIGIAGALTTATPGLSQNNNTDTTISNIKYTVSISEYESLIQQRDDYINKNWKTGKMDPSRYFVLNQKSMFLNDVKINRYEIGDKLKKIKNILTNKFDVNTSNDPVNIIKLALENIANEKNNQGFKSFTVNLSDKFDINLINAYGYIQTNIQGIKKDSYGTTLPSIRLNDDVLDQILYILEKGEYTIDFYTAQENAKKRNNKINNEPSIQEDDRKEEDQKPNLDPNEQDLNNLLGEEDDASTLGGDTSKIETPKNDEPKINDDNNKTDTNKTKLDSNNSDNNIELNSEPDEQDLNNLLGKEDDASTLDSDTSKIETSQLRTIENKTNDGDDNNNDGVNPDKTKLDSNNSKNFLSDLESVQRDAKLRLKELEQIDETKRTDDDKSKIRVLKEAIEDNQKQIDSLKNNNNNQDEINNNKELDILDIVNNMSWDVDVLSKKLDTNKLNNISHQEIIEVVNTFKSIELQKAFMYALLDNDIEYAQILMGMDLNCSNHYPNYKASNTLGKNELNKIKKLGQTRKYMQQKEILANKYIPQDVKDAYMNFVNGIFNNKGLNYTIISKIDMHMYMFLAQNILVARQGVGLGKHTGDQKNRPPSSKTTPGGMYKINERYRTDQNKRNMFDKYNSHYITLYPTEGQYTYPNKNGYTMGIHGAWMQELTTREMGIKSKNRNTHRISAGCINILSNYFGEIYNHLKLGASLYVTKEPDTNDLNKFKEQIKSR